MSIDKDYVKDRLTADHVLKIMEELGAGEPKPEKDAYRYQTICHGGDSNKLYFYPDSKTFQCYTECGQMDIFEVVMKVKDCSFFEALQMVADYTGSSGLREGFIHNELSGHWELIKKYRMLRKTISSYDLKTYSPNVLKLFKDLYFSKWLEEGITEQAMGKFGIKYDAIRNRIIIPHFDINGNLVGIKGRALQQADIEAGYKYLPIEVQGVEYAYEQKYNLYGLNFNKDNIKRLKKVAIFEAEKSVLQCESFYGERNFSIATCNSSISPYQRQLILGLNPETVYICFDKEYTEEDYKNKTEVYVKYCEKLMKLASLFSPYARTYIVYDSFHVLPYKGSPSDMGKETLEWLMKHSYEVKTKGV